MSLTSVLDDYLSFLRSNYNGGTNRDLAPELYAQAVEARAATDRLLSVAKRALAHIQDEKLGYPRGPHEAKLRSIELSDAIKRVEAQP